MKHGPNLGRTTDNQSLGSKVAIRRWLLERMGVTEAYVLDVYAGAGLVWTAMEDHVTIRQWTRCDVKPRKEGTLAIDAVTALRRFDLSTYNVIDIDPYGDPWEAYAAVLPRLVRPTAVFLSRGTVGPGLSSHAALRMVGLPTDWPLPNVHATSAFVAQQLLARTWRYVDIQHSAELVLHRVAYYALALTPRAT